MDFFEAQDKARRRTKLLVFYFAMAVLGIITAIYALLVTFFGHSEGQGFSLFQPELLALAAVGSIAVIGLGSLFKTWQLGAGGQAVAKELGGRLVERDTSDPAEKQLLNIVDEMAIASGTPVPDVYLIDDDSINAFAAGKTTSDAVIGVTRGCMNLLNRDELQGVIAHEFSHILNGDMRLNIRLMGLLFGILMITIIGRIVLRSAALSGRRGSRNNGGGALAFLAFGIGLLAIGAIGVLFARLIQAAVSRQREFLADASAVQFTRLPDGIAGALKKIGGAVSGSKVDHPRTQEASHMFFANAMSSSLSGAFATHPPLPVRIRAIMPQWDGSFPKNLSPPDITARQPGTTKQRAGMTSNLAGAATVGLRAESVGNTLQRGAVELNSAHLEAARQSHQRIPADILEQLKSQQGARLTVMATLASRDGDEPPEAELEVIRQHCGSDAVGQVRTAVQSLKPLATADRLAVIDVAFPTLRRMDQGAHEKFVAAMRAMMAADEQIDLFEFTVERMVERHLDLFFNPRRKHRTDVRHLSRIEEELSILISTLAGLSSSDPDARKQSFTAGANALQEHEPSLKLEHLGPEHCGLDRVGEALTRCDRATPLIKKALLYGCGKAVVSDDEVNDLEAQLLRAIADAIGCPMPPFVDTTQPAA